MCGLCIDGQPGECPEIFTTEQSRTGEKAILKFDVVAETKFGERVVLLGAAPELGSWRRNASVELDTTPETFPVWSASVSFALPPAAGVSCQGGGATTLVRTAVEFKFAVARADGSLLWESGDNHSVTIDQDGVRVASRFGENDSLKIEPLTVQEQPSPLVAATSCAVAASPEIHLHVNYFEGGSDAGRTGEERVAFEATCSSTRPGDVLVVVGGCQELGDWDPAKGLALTTEVASFPLWRGRALLGTALRVAAAGPTTALAAASEKVAAVGGASPGVSWKLAILRSGGGVEWEAGENRNLEQFRTSSVRLCRATFRLSTQTDSLETAFGSLAAALPEVKALPSLGSPPVTPLTLSPPPSPCTVPLPLPSPLRRERPGAGFLGLGLSGLDVLPPLELLLGDKCADRGKGSGDDDDHSTTVPDDIGFSRQPSPEAMSVMSHEGRRLALSQEDMEYLCMQTEDEQIYCELKFWACGHQVPKSPGNCEDAFFVGSSSLGIADGVGCMSEFVKYGVSAADYANDLMERAASALRRPRAPRSGCGGGPRRLYRRLPDADADSVDQRALKALAEAEDEATAFGAATALVMDLSGGVAGVANLGDSGFMLIRGATPEAATSPGTLEIIVRSTEQQHSYNCPFQLTRIPRSLAAITTMRNRDTAADSLLYQFDVLPGDLVLLFTDGFSDNLFDAEILKVLSQQLWPAPQDDMQGARSCGGFDSSDDEGPLPGLPSPELISRALTRAARRRSVDPEARVPFNETGARWGSGGGGRVIGGKEDDITVVAAWVVPEL